MRFVGERREGDGTEGWLAGESWLGPWPAAERGGGLVCLVVLQVLAAAAYILEYRYDTATDTPFQLIHSPYNFASMLRRASSKLIQI